jgi:hypothetical protein
VTGNLARLALIVGKYLQEVHSLKPKPSLSVYEHFVLLLDTWASMLPPSLRFTHQRMDTDDQNNSSPRDEVASVFSIR